MQDNGLGEEDMINDISPERLNGVIKRLNENSALNIADVSSNETIDAHKIVINCLKMYNLTEVVEMNYHAHLANEIINDLVNAGFMK